jgi:hypothetical protein
MKVKELIELLKKCNPDAEVLANDYYAVQDMPVSGIEYTTRSVVICTDDMQE